MDADLTKNIARAIELYDQDILNHEEMKEYERLRENPAVKKSLDDLLAKLESHETINPVEEGVSAAVVGADEKTRGTPEPADAAKAGPSESSATEEAKAKGLTAFGIQNETHLEEAVQNILTYSDNVGVEVAKPGWGLPSTWVQNGTIKLTIEPQTTSPDRDGKRDTIYISMVE
jgi:hypothetical protein